MPNSVQFSNTVNEGKNRNWSDFFSLTLSMFVCLIQIRFSLAFHYARESEEMYSGADQSSCLP